MQGRVWLVRAAAAEVAKIYGNLRGRLVNPNYLRGPATRIMFRRSLPFHIINDAVAHEF